MHEHKIKHASIPRSNQKHGKESKQPGCLRLRLGLVGGFDQLHQFNLTYHQGSEERDDHEHHSERGSGQPDCVQRDIESKSFFNRQQVRTDQQDKLGENKSCSDSCDNGAEADQNVLDEQQLMQLLTRHAQQHQNTELAFAQLQEGTDRIHQKEEREDEDNILGDFHAHTCQHAHRSTCGNQFSLEIRMEEKQCIDEEDHDREGTA
ncbi:hypothetical protein D3C72_1714880 [compost metagenome]